MKYSKLNFDKNELLIERAEQLMILKHLKPDSCVQFPRRFKMEKNNFKMIDKLLKT